MAAPSVNSNQVLIADFNANGSDAAPGAPGLFIANSIFTFGASDGLGNGEFLKSTSGQASGPASFYGGNGTFPAEDSTGKLVTVEWGQFSLGSANRIYNLSADDGVAVVLTDSGGGYRGWIVGGKNTLGAQILSPAVIDPADDRNTFLDSSFDPTAISQVYLGANKETNQHELLGRDCFLTGAQEIIGGEVGDPASFSTLAESETRGIVISGAQVICPFPVQIGDGSTETYFRSSGQSFQPDPQEFSVSGLTADRHILAASLPLRFLLSPTDDVELLGSHLATTKAITVEVLPGTSPLARLVLSGVAIASIAQVISRAPLEFSGPVVGLTGPYVMIGGAIANASIIESAAAAALEYYDGTAQNVVVESGSGSGLALHSLGDYSALGIAFNDNGVNDIALDLAWSDGNYYRVGSIVYDAAAAAPGWYVATADGVSDGTGVDDDTGPTWAARTTEPLEIDLSGCSFAGGSSSPTNIRRLNDGSTDAITAIVGQSGLVVASDAAGGVSLQEPAASLSAPNFAEGVRFYAERVQTFAISSADISTATNEITLGNDAETGAAFAGQSAAPATLALLTLAAGATIPTTDPQVVSGNLYYVSAAAGGVIELSETQGGPAIDWQNTGAAAAGALLTLTTGTQLINELVSSGGVSTALTLPTGAIINIAAQDRPNAASASTLFTRAVIWDSAAGASLPDVFSAANNPNLVHNALVGATITSKSGITVTVTSDGAAVTGLTFDLSGNIELDANGITDNVISFPDGYLWMVAQRYSEAGIRFVRDQFVANGVMDFRFNGLTIDNTADGVRNAPATPLTIYGNVEPATQGDPVVADGSGTLHIIPFFVADVSSAGDGSFTSGDRTDLQALAAALQVSGVFSTAALANAPQPLTQAGIRSALGIAAANVDSQLTAILAAAQDKAGYSLTPAERDAIATAVEAAIINEGDGQQVVDAILQVFNANLDLPALELTAIANQVQATLAPDFTGLQGHGDANWRTAVGFLAAADKADILTEIGALPSADDVWSADPRTLTAAPTPHSTAATLALQQAIEGLVNELRLLQGLDPANPLQVTDNSITVGSISQAITDDGTTTTVTRQP